MGKQIWGNGPHAGEEVKNTPIKIRSGDSLKMDPDASEAALRRAELARMGDIGFLKNRAEYHAALAEMSAGALKAAEAVDRDPRLVANQMPPSKWPLRILVAAMLALFFTMLVVMWRVERMGRPTLPSPSDEAPRRGVLSRSRAVPERQGREVVASSTHMRTGEP